MSARGRLPLPELGAFAALAGFASLHWATLVADPPFAGALAAALAATVGAAAVAAFGRGGSLGLAAGLAIALATTAAAAIAIGVPARDLAPGRWGELLDNLGHGLSRVGDADYPYAGRDEWARLSILVWLPVAGALASLLAFGPGRRHDRAGLAGLIVLVVTFTAAAMIDPPGAPILQGLVLFLLVAAWLWAPTLRRRNAAAAFALVLVAGAAALAPAARLDAADPWLDYTEWSWERAAAAETFDWNHSYGPIDWPRDGDVVLEVASEEPHYWRAVVLDRFDGFRWTAASTAEPQRDLPGQLEDPATTAVLRAAWTDRIEFSVRSLDSRFVVGAGGVIGVTGIANVHPTAAGILLPQRRPLEEGDAYSVLAYTPTPTDRRMRAANGPYPQSLLADTTVSVPTSGEAVFGAQVPLWGSPAAGEASSLFDSSPYGGLYRLARRLTAGAPTTFDAVEAVAEHFRQGYVYDESPPRRRYPLQAFLFRDRAGYCQQFSGAMALMLRSVGIPSRVAAGFSPGERSPDGYVVRDLDAHSWVEVYFPRIGWVAFDPTPADAPAASRALRPGAPIVSTAPTEPKPRKRRQQPVPAAAGGGPEGGSGGWLAPLLALPALALAAVAGTVALRARRRRALAPDDLADAQLRELGAGLARLRRPLPPATTLLGLERRMRVTRRPTVAAYAARLRRARYAGLDGPASAAERSAVRRELSAGGGLGLRLRGFVAFPPGGPAR